MNTAIKVSLVAVLAVFAMPVFAAKGLSQSFADVGYARFNGDDYDYDGATVDAAFGIFKYVSLRAGYTRGFTDNFPENRDRSGDPDLNDFRFGARPHYSFSKELDIYADILYNNKKFNGDSSRTQIGGIYGAGVRYLVMKKLELDVGLEYRSADIDAAFATVGGTFRVTKVLGITVKTNQALDDQNYFAGLRLFF
ncbi:hypothetical protein MNBD_GAMMA13-202 [hydrothermal vent metagenome]|uniref:Outer membrane protein beta-barrel domain-containing protein n=1 Tax=hydrothermal vent metagenome TaxID=652676 RepID=A0A3B0XX18_9ZZZZ